MEELKALAARNCREGFRALTQNRRATKRPMRRSDRSGSFPDRGAPADLATHNCTRIRFPSGAIYKWELGKRGEEHAIDVSGSLTLDNHHLMIEAAFQCVGLADQRIRGGARCRCRPIDPRSERLDAAVSGPVPVLPGASSCAGRVARVHRRRQRDRTDAIESRAGHRARWIDRLFWAATSLWGRPRQPARRDSKAVS